MEQRPHQGGSDRGTILATLRAREAELRAAGVAALYLFGSAARGEATEHSDVDLFLDQADPAAFDLLDLVALGEQIGGVLGATVDLATRGSLHPVLRPAIEASAVRVF